MAAICLTLVLAAVMCACQALRSSDRAPGGQDSARDAAPRDRQIAALAASIENVQAAKARRYGLRDDQGARIETLKIIANPSGGYLGVYHTSIRETFVTRVATSTDLLTWRYRADLDSHASQPSVSTLSDGGFLLAEERDNADSAAPHGRWLRFRHYPNLPALLAAHPDRTFDPPHTLVPADQGAEGTPNVYAALLEPDLSHSRIDVGFHYLTGGVDREARGTLVDFSTWRTRADRDLDAALDNLGASGKHGDRDTVTVSGGTYTIVEAQDRTSGMWQVYLRDETSKAIRPLRVQTKGRSRSFSNPALALLRGTDGHLMLVITLFVPRSGAARGEAGELVYYVDLPKALLDGVVVAAAGDIACAADALPAPDRCGQAATAALVASLRPDAVLAVGDVQYEHGSLENFLASYAPTWGRFKSITYPVPGNHDYASGGVTGYFDYFGTVAGDSAHPYYSFDIGGWHVVALNSECAAFGGGCDLGSTQDRWLAADLAAHRSRCTLAFFHRPLFTSGTEGPTPEMRALWKRLYEADADLVVNGHDHDYERFARQDPEGNPDPERGITEFVVGTGGKSLHGFARVAGNSVVRYAGAFGVLKLVLKPGSYAWTFLRVGGGPPVDQGSARCR